ncbi:Hypothetical predicted protein [Octopus vulgaris]|uniref:Uncharacterized protein n=1 Tax=Octopus vulgaris TaxID=6645 RepID=A0AA36FFU6_OCTVU|nr:Hypothetical predicted protein [Octopus vulgaris]
MGENPSTSAKLVFNTDIVQQFCQLVSSSSSIALFQSIICSEALTNVLWAICVGFVILFNVLMWTTFTKALQYFSSTVEASATNTASSFLFSAILGWIIFSEHLNLQWFAGDGGGRGGGGGCGGGGDGGGRGGGGGGGRGRGGGIYLLIIWL